MHFKFPVRLNIQHRHTFTESLFSISVHGCQVYDGKYILNTIKNITGHIKAREYLFKNEKCKFIEKKLSIIL